MHRTPVPDEEVTVVDLMDETSNPSLASALRRCLTDPQDPAAWDALDAATATTALEAAHVEELYRTTLERNLPREILLRVGAAALRLHDEWAFHEECLIKLLGRVLEIDAKVVWAFDRLSLELTTHGRYSDLLALYDRVIAAVDGERRAALLEEAADVALDCAGEVDRAIAYLERLLAADPQRQVVAATLERLLAQRGRHEDLIAHWTLRIALEGPARAVVLRCRMARFCLETMADPGRATDALAPLSPGDGDEDVARLLEGIIEAPSALPVVRSQALDQLRARHDSQGRSVELIPPLRALLSREGSDSVALRAEIVRRLVADGRDGETLDDLATLLARQAAGLDVAMVERLLGDGFDGELAGCRPSIARDGRREIVRRAARFAPPLSGGPEWAIGLYQRLLRDTPSDPGVLNGLAELYEAGGRRAELIELRRHELDLAEDAGHRRALRLKLAALHLSLGDTLAALAALGQNLDDRPTDPEVIDAVLRVLETHGQLEPLCDLLEHHAAAVATLAPRVAIALWARAAEVAESGLEDRRRTIEAHRRIVAISPEVSSFDALARIHTDLGEHVAAVECLKQLLSTEASSSSTHTANVLRLASAQLAAGRAGEALASVEERLVIDPGDMSLHMMRIDVRRASPDREALVGALVAAVPHAEPTMACSLLREGATVLTEELAAPARGVLLLERAVALRPDVQSRAMLAAALHRAGSRQEARAMARKALSDFGARHPQERADVHLLLGRIARELGDGDEARRELECAVKTDMGNASAHLLLGKLCREAGELDRAERALHAALLLQRRGSDDGVPPRSETLVELHRLAAGRGDALRAAENMAAAFDVATCSEREARGLEQALRDAQMLEPLLRALDGHLLSTEEPAARAGILCDISTVLDSLGRHDEATGAALRGLALAPADSRLHELARGAAIRAGRVGGYVERLESLIAAALEEGDGVVGCSLLLRLGAVYENDLERPDAADAAYARAEDTSENIIDVWRRRAALAERRGEREAQLVFLGRLAASASDLGPSERADTLYALADLELESSESQDAGLSSLTRALEVEARPAPAAASLRKALAVASDPEPIARLYETVARAHGDDAMLLDALSIASSLPRPAQCVIQEAFELARRLGAPDRATRLLERAVSVARDAADPAEALWAMRLLMGQCELRRDLRGALSWALQAANVSEGEESSQFSATAAASATTLGDVDTALAAYERLLADDPGDPNVWASMLELLRGTGDAPRLEAALARAAIESREPARRNLLRMERARLLLADDSRRSDVKTALQAVLEEDPDHIAAADFLSGLLDPTTERDELALLLTRRLEVAQERRDGEATPLALRLADLMPSADAAEVVRSALRTVPSSAPLLRRLVELLDPQADGVERADAIERLLAAWDEGASSEDVAAERTGRAAELVRARVAACDADGTERAIDALSSLEPGHPELLVALEWLARARIAEAGDRPDAAGPLLCAAARHQDRLGDGTGALETLSRACAAVPEDDEVLDLYTRRLLDSGRGDLAIPVVSEAILRSSDPRRRAHRLAIRASLRTARGEHEVAVVDLEEAQALADEWLPELVAALDRARRVAQPGDVSRALALREAEVLEVAGRVEDARALLDEVAGDDPVVLRRLLAADVLAERWDRVAADGERLMATAEGRELAEMALTVASALECLGRPEEARANLERAHDADPSNVAVLDWLRDLYLRAGALRELSNRLFLDAQRTTDEQRRFDRLVEVGQLRLKRLGEAASAIGPLSEALDLRPEDPVATSLLVDALAEAGLTDDAVAMLGAAIDRHGPRRSRELSELQRRMAHVVSESDPAAALQWLTVAFDSNPKSTELAAELANLALARNEYDVAARALRGLTSKQCEPEVRARAYVAQADIALRQANKPRALVCARKAHAEAPELAEVEAMMRQLGR